MSAAEGMGDVVIPPPDIKTVVDQTALFVAKNGPAFEAMIRQKEGHKQKFQFLLLESPYHSYYRAKLAAQSQVQTAAQPSSSGQPSIAQDLQSQQQSRPPPLVSHPPPPQIVSQTVAKPAVIRAPPSPRKFHVPLGADYEFVEVESVRISAERAALAGSVTAVEKTADCSRPSHRLHNLFLSFYEAYRALLDDLRTQVGSADAGGAVRCRHPRAVFTILDGCRSRAEWQQVEAERRDIDAARKRGTAVVERYEIDWGDFVVVETITLEGVVDVAADAVSDSLPLPSGAASSSSFGGLPIVSPEDVAVNLQQQRRSAGAAMVRDPLTGQSVPLASLEEHLRVSLMSAEWKRLKEMERSKLQTTNLAGGAAVSEALARFVAGPRASPASRDVGGDDAAAGRPIYDGRARTARMMRKEMTRPAVVHQQIEAVHRAIQRDQEAGDKDSGERPAKRTNM